MVLRLLVFLWCSIWCEWFCVWWSAWYVYVCGTWHSLLFILFCARWCYVWRSVVGMCGWACAKKVSAACWYVFMDVLVLVLVLCVLLLCVVVVLLCCVEVLFWLHVRMFTCFHVLTLNLVIGNYLGRNKVNTSTTPHYTTTNTSTRKQHWVATHLTRGTEGIPHMDVYICRCWWRVNNARTHVFTAGVMIMMRLACSKSICLCVATCISLGSWLYCSDWFVHMLETWPTRRF